LNYDWLRAHDPELASGAVEGTVSHVIKKRLDYGGIRWIRERAAAVLQLRCIEVNEDGEAFMAFMQEKLRKATTEDHKIIRLLTWKAARIQDRAPSA
jgi:hypothetical protein